MDIKYMEMPTRETLRNNWKLGPNKKMTYKQYVAYAKFTIEQNNKLYAEQEALNQKNFMIGKVR